MKNGIIIVGAGLMGREVAVYAEECGFAVKGFLDSRTTILNGFHGYPPILSSVEAYELKPDDRFVCAIGDPGLRLEYADRIALRGGRFATIVHPRSYIGRNVVVEEGSIIAPNASVTCDTRLGRHAIVNVNASVSHDCVFGDGCTLSPGCHVEGLCRFGARVFVGVGASVIPNIELGDGVYVAAGAVVVKSVASGRVMGVPAHQG